MAKKVAVVQINNEFDGQLYLPLVAGYLEGIILQDASLSSKFEFISPIYKRTSVPLAVSHLSDCDIVAFSIYVWNEQLSLAVARELRKLRQDCLIIFGGPQVPDNAKSYMLSHAFIDICVHNEGEMAFKSILQNFESKKFAGIPNTSVRIKLNRLETIEKSENAKRLNSLAEVPSPFLNGIFDKILVNNSDQKFLALWESNRGCPFQCSFCDWGSATASKVNQFDIERLKLEIEWIAKNQIEFVFVCDANFGILPRDEEIANHVVQMKNIFGFPKAFSVQNTKNVKERAFNVQKILAGSGLGKGVTLSMQSLNEKTLEFIKRDNISLDSYADLQNRFREAKIATYSDLILGLPGETFESWKSGIGHLILNGQHNRIQFNNLSILPNAEMGSEDYQKLHGFIKVKSQIVNVHGSKHQLENDIAEVQELVVGTATMPIDQWVKSRIFAWWVAFLYFDKICQIPIMLMSAKTGNSVVHIIEFILEKMSSSRVLSFINSQFMLHAESIQNGGVEYIWDRQLIDVFWPADEYAFIILCRDAKIQQFYVEIREILQNYEQIYLNKQDDSSNAALSFKVEDAMDLNSFLLNVPSGLEFNFDPYTFEVLYDWYLKAPYEKNLVVNFFHLKPKTLPNRKFYEFEQWCREIVWYGHRSGAYIFNHQFERKDESLDSIPGILT